MLARLSSEFSDSRCCRDTYVPDESRRGPGTAERQCRPTPGRWSLLPGPCRSQKRAGQFAQKTGRLKPAPGRLRGTRPAPVQRRIVGATTGRLAVMAPGCCQPRRDHRSGSVSTEDRFQAHLSSLRFKLPFATTGFAVKRYVRSNSCTYSFCRRRVGFTILLFCGLLGSRSRMLPSGALKAVRTRGSRFEASVLGWHRHD